MDRTLKNKLIELRLDIEGLHEYTHSEEFNVLTMRTKLEKSINKFRKTLTERDIEWS